MNFNNFKNCKAVSYQVSDFKELNELFDFTRFESLEKVTINVFPELNSGKYFMEFPENFKIKFYHCINRLFEMNTAKGFVLQNLMNTFCSNNNKMFKSVDLKCKDLYI